ncbi:tatD [Mytilus coruscus]|uniref:TatD n=1 Tax=Mytilus coruscus TaxID=42192 RepID=A0A6J8EJZ8_MYTCO|nr:tatD [Mytilus coruscus]
MVREACTDRHRPGKKHLNAYGLSRIPDCLEDCDCYNAGAEVENLPCKSCQYCQRAHTQWSRFLNDVDDVKPLSKRHISPLEVKIANVEENPTTQSEESFNSSIQGLQASSFSVADSKEHDITQRNIEGDAIYTNLMQNCRSHHLRQLQLQDSDLFPLIEWIESQYDISVAELRLQSPATRALWLLGSCLEVIDGVLYYKWINQSERKPCLVVPNSLKSDVLLHCHDSKVAGQLGQQKTLDRFSKWIEMAALPEQSALLIAQKCVVHFIVTFGCPLEVHTDQGRNFDGNLFKALFHLDQILRRMRLRNFQHLQSVVAPVCSFYYGVANYIFPSRLNNWDSDVGFACGVYVSFGIHSHLAAEGVSKRQMDQLDSLTDSHLYVAIGEVGLDYTTTCICRPCRNPSRCKEEARRNQKEAFINMLLSARRKSLPVIIHCRDCGDGSAAKRTLELILHHNLADMKFSRHCFEGTIEELTAWQQLPTIMFGVSGKFIRDNTGLEVIPRIPPHQLVLETDSPFLSPPHAVGTRNLIDRAYAVFTRNSIDRAYAVGTRHSINRAYAVGTRNSIDRAYAVGIRNSIDKAYAVGTRNSIVRAYAVGTRNSIDRAYAVGTRNSVDRAYAVGTRNSIDRVYAVGPRNSIDRAYAVGTTKT